METEQSKLETNNSSKPLIAKWIRELYIKAISTYSRQPTEHECEAWQTVLGHTSYSDVDAAIRRWQADTTIDSFTNRPIGSRMPTPAELKRSIQVFDESSERRNSRKFKPCGKCEGGWIRIFNCRTEGGQPSNPKLGAMRRCQCFYEWAKTKAS